MTALVRHYSSHTAITLVMSLGFHVGAALILGYVGRLPAKDVAAMNLAFNVLVPQLRVPELVPVPEPAPVIEPRRTVPQIKTRAVKRRKALRRAVPVRKKRPEPRVEELGEPEAAPEKQAVVVMDRPAVASDTGVAVAAAGAAERGQAASSGEDLINRSGSEHGAGKAVEQIDLRSLAKQWTERVNQVLRHRVQTSYPLAARRMRHQGVVWLAVHVSPDGKIRTVELKRPSGHATLDRAALGILRTLERLPHPPVPLAPHLRRSPLTIPINFRLD